ncbi:MAG: LysM peptidoglycan-binding domain-containing protein [Acidimicrobiales bacterium]|nr:LysM peptidoglycan-binding domain-containing protein [Acidimicrobiales bacterium]MCB9394166.1 LysM peptidoglycan-binding domain-containing protein [Acidimicrobiaceae bacterium]
MTPGPSLLRRCAVAVAVTVALAACGGDEGDDAAATSTTAAATTVTTAAPTVPPSTTPDTSPGAVLASPIEYTVVAGDSPARIAATYSISLDALLAENGWTLVDQQVPEFPFAGAVIRIPAGATVPVPTTPAASTDGGTDGGADGGTDGGTDAAADTKEPESGSCGTYVIMEGDNPTVVATKLDTTVEKLNAVNANTSGYSSFYEGLSIEVPC